MSRTDRAKRYKDKIKVFKPRAKDRQQEQDEIEELIEEYIEEREQWEDTKTSKKD